MLFENFTEHIICVFGIKGTVFFEENARFRVNKIIAQVFCQNHRVQIFTARSRVIFTDMMRNGKLDFFKFLLKGKIKPELFNNLIISLFDFCKNRFDILLFSCRFKAGIEHIRHFNILGEALAGSGGNHISSFVVRLDDFGNLFKLLCTGKRAAAEFQCFYSHRINPLYK